MPDPRSDRELLAAHVAGHDGAFDEIVRRYAERLWLLAFRTLDHREDAADAVQETFVSALRGSGTPVTLASGRRPPGPFGEARSDQGPARWMLTSASSLTYWSSSSCPSAVIQISRLPVGGAACSGMTSWSPSTCPAPRSWVWASGTSAVGALRTSMRVPGLGERTVTDATDAGAVNVLIMPIPGLSAGSCWRYSEVDHVVDGSLSAARLIRVGLSGLPAGL